MNATLSALSRATVEPDPWSGAWIEIGVNAQAELSHGSTPGFFYLSNVRVADAVRRQGWGRVLMEAVIEYATIQRKGVRLHVWADNIPAIRLYESVGFTITESSPDSTPEHQRCHVMERALW